MQYVNLGRSNLKISRLGLGAMGIGDKSWRSWVLDENEARPILRRALDLGINFVDTCDYYSSGRSEEVLGRFMGSFVRREEIVLATKVGNPMGKGPNAKGYSRKHLHEAVDQSLRRLQTDYIDLYQTHIWDPATQIEEMVDAFDSLVQSGKVLYVGVTDMPAWQLAKAYYYAARSHRAHFISVQNHYNPIWREDERELMPLCRAEGLGIIPYSPMARGFLTGKSRRDGSAPTERLRSDDYALKIYGRPNDTAVAAAVESVAVAQGLAPAQVALAWTLSRPGVTAPIFGATRVEHVDAAAAALEIGLGSEAITVISQAYEPRGAFIPSN
jgi:aryl-alcohol dehydrogenase-like predicted oxidoreductase